MDFAGSARDESVVLVGRSAMNELGAVYGPTRELLRPWNDGLVLANLDELDEIASLDGIDMLFFGPGDFSHGIGAPGEWNHPKIVEARNRVVEAALAHEKFAGTVSGLWDIEELIEMGYRFINLGADVIGIAEYAKNLLENFPNKK